MPRGVLGLAREVTQHVEGLVAGDGIETGGRLVEHEQLRPMREGNRKLQLHPHAAREVGDASLQRKAEGGGKRLEARLVPGGICGRHAGSGLGHRAVPREGTGVEHHAHARAHGSGVGSVSAGIERAAE